MAGRPCALPLAALLLLAPGARAETAVLRNGQRLHISGYERAGEILRLRVPGGRVEVRAEDIIAIEPEESFPLRVQDATPARPIADVIRSVAQKHGVDEDLIASVIAAESDFNPRAISRKNARGLMQLMPETATRLEAGDVFDPTQNIEAGTRYLKELLARYNQSLALTLAAYNAGPERVEQYGGVPPFPETREYVRRVLREIEKRKKQNQP